MALLKRKLSDMSSSGDSLAEEALQKITEQGKRAEANQEKQASEEAPEQGENAGRGRARKRGVRAIKKAKKRAGPEKPRYARKRGDELRLINKRAIATWYLFAYSRYLRVLYPCSTSLCHLLGQFSANTG